MEHVARRRPEIIILTDSEEDSDSDDMAGITPDCTSSDDDASPGASIGAYPDSPNYAAFLDDIPDVDMPPGSDGPANPRASAEVDIITEAEGLQRILNIFPDIAVDHVLKLIGGARQITSDWCERLIGQILDSGRYPKENDEQNKLKRKRIADEDDIAEFEKNDQDSGNPKYFQQALQLLQEEFREIPVKHVQATLRAQHTLFKAFSVLDHQLRNYDSLAYAPFGKVRTRPPKRARTLDPSTEDMGDLMKELAAARKKRDKTMAESQQIEREKKAEEDNLKMAQLNNEMSQCLCCFDDFPTNRMTFCDGPIIHLFCWDCAGRYVKEELGNSRCRPICFAGQDNCVAGFARQELQVFLDKHSFERLQRLQQQEDIKAAGLENLEACPFCDFQAVCPPVEIDREFRCENDGCRKISCRLCQAESHVPLTCDEFKKDNKIALKHAVEEARTKALIRVCNRCQNPFIKETGCNKMTCTKCGNVQCYVCSQDVKDGYSHFSSGPRDKRCPLHENTDQRHDEDVKKAEEQTLARLREENPDMTKEELKVQFSDRVKQDELARQQRAAAGYHMQDLPGFEDLEEELEGLRNDIHFRHRFPRVPFPHHPHHPMLPMQAAQNPMQAAPFMPPHNPLPNVPPPPHFAVPPLGMNPQVEFDLRQLEQRLFPGRFPAENGGQNQGQNQGGNLPLAPALDPNVPRNYRYDHEDIQQQLQAQQRAALAQQRAGLAQQQRALVEQRALFWGLQNQHMGALRAQRGPQGEQQVHERLEQQQEDGINLARQRDQMGDQLRQLQERMRRPY